MTYKTKSTHYTLTKRQHCVVVKSKGTGPTSRVQVPSLQLTGLVISGPSASLPQRGRGQNPAYTSRIAVRKALSAALSRVRTPSPLITITFDKGLWRASSINALREQIQFKTNFPPTGDATPLHNVRAF